MKNGLAFGLGLLVGCGGATLLANTILKQQYAQKADEEITACREAFLEESKKLRAKQDTRTAQERKEAAVAAVKTYSTEPDQAAQMVQKATDIPAQTEKPKDWKTPYVIDPALFDAMDNPNKTFGLKYYPQDGVVTYAENDVPLTMDELDKAVGREALLHFDQNEFGESDRVCVRNDNWGVDYEICVQPKSYADILKEKPWLKK